MSGLNIPVSFTGDFSSVVDGLGKALASGVGKVSGIGSAVGDSYANGMLGKLASRMVSDGRYAMDALGGVLKAGATVVGTAVTGLLAGAFAKGFSRLTALDEAEAKLKGLGHSTETITKVMENARAAVDGTAHGMGAAATAAAGAMSAGIKPGAELERVLKAVANSSSAMGRGMEETGGIFNRVSNNMKATNLELGMFADAGIDIYGSLSEVMGVAKEDVFDLARAGQVSFDDFLTAAELATGGIAQAMGGTLKGSLDNFGAAIGRVGAEFMKPTFKQAAGVIQNISASFKPLEEAAGKAGEKVGEAVEVMVNALSGKSELGDFSGALGVINDVAINVRDAIGKITDIVGPFWDSLSSGQKATAGVAGVAGAFGSILPLLGKLPVVGGAFSSMVPSLSQIGGLLKFATGPLGILIGLLVAAFATSEDFRGAVGGLFEAVMPLAQTLMDTLVPAISQLAPLFGELVAAITPLLTAIVDIAAELIAMLVPVISQLIETLVPILTTVIEVLAEVFMALVPVITTIVEALANILFPVIEALLPIVETVIGAVGDIFNSLVDIFKATIDLIKAVFTGDWDAAWQALKDVASAVIEYFKTLGSSLWQIGVDLITGLIDGIVSMVAGIGTAIWDIGVALIDAFKSLLGISSPSTVFLQFGVDILMGLIDGLKSMFGSLVGIVATIPGRIFSALGNFGSHLLSAGRGFIQGLINGAQALFGTVTSTIKRVPGLVLSALGNVGTFLKDSGRKLISGLTDGIRAGFDKAKSVVTGGLGKLRKLFPFSPAKEGPFSGRGWTLYSGESIAEALADGLRSSGYDVIREAEEIARGASQVLGGIHADPVVSSVSGASLARETPAVSGSVEYTTYGDISINVDIEKLEQLETLDDLMELIRQARVDSRRTRRSGTVVN